MKRKKKLRIRHIILAAIACCMIYTFIDQQTVINRKKAEISKYNQEYSKLQAENEDLKDKVDFSKTKEYKEEMAREMMGLIRPGETVYVIDQQPQK